MRRATRLLCQEPSDGRSDSWLSSDPKPYLARLRQVCREQVRRHLQDPDAVQVFAVGAQLTHWQDVVLSRLYKQCSDLIKREIDRGQSVYDPLFHVYNLTARAIEQRLNAANDAVQRRERLNVSTERVS